MRAKIEYRLAAGLKPLELVVADYEAQRFRPHWHSGFAIGAVTRNAQGFRCDGKDWVAGPGDLILLNPGQVHDGYSLGAGWSTRMAYLPEDTLALLLPPATGQRWRFVEPLVHDPVLRSAFIAWHEAAALAAGIEKAQQTTALFEGLAHCMRSEAEPVAQGNAAPVTARQRLRQMAEECRPSVARFQQQMDCSRTTSWRRAKEDSGMAPKPLMSQYRLLSAKSMLANGASVVDAAMECGYHDQSHLSREFAAAYGITPAQFRRVQQGR